MSPIYIFCYFFVDVLAAIKLKGKWQTLDFNLFHTAS